MDISRWVGPSDRSEMPPQRQLGHDLLYAIVGPVIAVVGGLLLRDDLTGYPLTFGLTWFILGVVVAGVRFRYALWRGA